MSHLPDDEFANHTRHNSILSLTLTGWPGRVCNKAHLCPKRQLPFRNHWHWALLVGSPGVMCAKGQASPAEQPCERKNLQGTLDRYSFFLVLNFAPASALPISSSTSELGATLLDVAAPLRPARGPVGRPTCCNSDASIAT